VLLRIQAGWLTLRRLVVADAVATAHLLAARLQTGFMHWQLRVSIVAAVRTVLVMDGNVTSLQHVFNSNAEKESQ
jgi:hypothetical protein